MARTASKANRPANKVYGAANGHMMEVGPSWSKFSGWYFVYALARHSDSCPCESYHVSEYAGEEE